LRLASSPHALTEHRKKRIYAPLLLLPVAVSKRLKKASAHQGARSLHNVSQFERQVQVAPTRTHATCTHTLQAFKALAALLHLDSVEGLVAQDEETKKAALATIAYHGAW